MFTMNFGIVQILPSVGLKLDNKFYLLERPQIIVYRL
jgi:hypothetical protein